MTIHVKISRWFSDEGPKIHYAGPSPRDGILLETEIVHPPSRKGQTVIVQIDQEMVTALLLALRDEAIRARR